jgi:drug/metabolite transporter (DMT)-like permease
MFFAMKWTYGNSAEEARRHLGLLPPLKEIAVKKTLGVILIVLGVFGLAWGGFTYTTKEKVVDIGPIHATRDETHNVPLPPIAGAVALVGGIFLLVAGRKE